MSETEKHKGDDGAASGSGEAGSRVDFSLLEGYILAKIHGGSDFPATSVAVSCITRLAETEDTSVTELTNMILKDYGLTSKLLKIVNTVNYAHFGEVTTISRALILLGTETIKHLAISMSLFEVVGKTPGLSKLLAKAIYAGMLGHRIAEKMGHINPEEAFICSLFHFFGEILTAYYAPLKYAEINRIRKTAKEKEQREEEDAWPGLYERVGVSIGTGWSFPDKLIQCMKRLFDGEITGKGEMELLHCICVLSSLLVEIPRNSRNRKERAKAAAETFGGRFDGIKDMSTVINTSREEIQEYCAAYGINVDRLLDLEEGARGKGLGPKADVTEMLESMSLDLSLKRHEKEMTPELIFARGFQDITNTIIDNRYGSVNDIMRVIMETMYRGLSHAGASKVAFFIRNTQGSLMEIRSIIGASLVQAKEWIDIALSEESFDVFNLSTRERKDLVVNDTRDYNLDQILPPCFQGRMEEDVYLIILPIIVNDVSIGVFYVEGPARDFKKITTSQFHQLKILLDQAVLAIKRRASRPVVSDDPETRHRSVLGLGKDDGAEEIKNKYKQALSKYHPDKVQHLGKEFHEIAEDKTKQILQAYKYFQQKYKF